MVCEEYKIMMNKTMMEDKLDGSRNSTFLEDNTSEEGLLWVIQKGDTMTTLFMNMSRGQRLVEIHWRNHINTLKYALVYIYYVYYCHEGNCRRKEPFVEVMDPKGS
jgi:hypothetical protein